MLALLSFSPTNLKRSRSGLLDRRLNHVVDRAERDIIVEHAGQQFHHAAQRTVADQRQGEDQLPQPDLRHRQVEEHLLVVAVRGRKGGVEGLFGLGGLAVNELAADRVLSGQTADRLGACQGLQGQLPPLGQRLRLGGWAGRGGALWAPAGRTSQRPSYRVGARRAESRR